MERTQKLLIVTVAAFTVLLVAGIVAARGRGLDDRGANTARQIGDVRDPDWAELEAADLVAELPAETSPLQPTSTPRPTSTPQPTTVPPTPTPLPVGFSRAMPYARSELVAAPNWDVQVLEVQRGKVAWMALQAANRFNDPPPEGMEYLLIKLRVKSTHTDSDDHRISGCDLGVTGDQLRVYPCAPVVKPHPQLDARLFSGGQTEGWSAYLIEQGEGNLILIVDRSMSLGSEQGRFIALDDGASIGVSPELAQIKATGTGQERAAPALLGDTVVTEAWKVTLREVIRGEDAWSMVEAANRFNDPPSEGMEYVAARVHVRFVGMEDRATRIDRSFFKFTGSAGVLYDSPWVVAPDPKLDAYLFPGGATEGWVVGQVAKEETDLMLVFTPISSRENRRFLSLEQ